jgi:signal transduction histidine kinase
MAVIGAAAVAIAGGDVAIILARQAAQGSTPSGRDAIWLGAFALFCAAMVVALRARPGGLAGRAAVAVQALCGLAMAASVPCYSAAFLLAWVAWQAGWLLPRGQAAGLVAVQAIAFAAAGALLSPHPPDGADVGMQIVLQCLALAAAVAVRREAAARGAAESLHGELVRANQRLADQARAAERGRLARELHDVLGHRLVALNLQLEIAERTPGQAGLGRARRLSRALLDDVRWVVRAFRDRPTDLRASVEELIGDLEQPRAHLRLDDDLGRASPIVAHALLRCVQEMVTNVLKHADADNLWIDLRRSEHFAEAKVRDDGAGRDGDAGSDGSEPGASLEPGVGLTGMRERLAMLGGDLVVDRPAGGGWSVTARVPLDAGEAAG